MQVHFSKRQQVWAKVEPYPWWPGKIINIHIQSEQIIYKILFFNDPTYAYLPQQQITGYSEFDRNINARYPHNSRLLRAVRMADDSFLKSQAMIQSSSCQLSLEQRKISTKSGRQAIVPCRQMLTPINSNQCQQRRERTEGQAENLKRTEHKQQLRCEETAFSPIQPEEEVNCQSLQATLQEITRENIIEVLQGRRNGEQKFEYDYENRKKSISHKAELKRKLLQRYNLHAIHEEAAQDILHPLPSQTHHAHLQPRHHHKSKKQIGKLRIYRKKSHLRHHSSQRLREKCIRKLYLTAKKSSSEMPHHNLKQLAISFILRLARVSEDNELRFKTLFTALIRQIQGPISAGHHRSLQDKMGDFTVCLDRFQHEKPEDEEGSKMTQVSTQGQ